jgi:hypothetical protein
MTFLKPVAMMAAVFGLAVGPARAATTPEATEPVKLTEAELDAVTAGDPIIDLNVLAGVNVTVQDINVNVNVDVPVNVGAIVQANVLGNATLFAQQFFPPAAP